MAIKIKSLGDQELSVASNAANPQTLVYTAPAGEDQSAVVRNIRIVNQGPLVVASVRIECKTTHADTATSSIPFRKVAPVNVTIPPHARFVHNEELTLWNGEQVQVTLLQPPPTLGGGTQTAKVDVVISGIERIE